MYEVRLKAPAKVNLILDILDKRPDGYHEVKMIMQAITLFDFVTLRRSQNSGIVIRSNVPELAGDETNIMWKAADLVRKTFGIREGVELVLEKHIPIAAGLAGGSADGAAVLKGLNRLFQLNLSREELMKLAAQLGSDVPFCLMGGTALATGHGEMIRPLAINADLFMVLVKDNFSVSTKDIYQRFQLNDHHPNTERMISALEKKDVAEISSNLGNLLESVTFSLYPHLEKIKKELGNAGALGVLMSGSGPTVFGLFPTAEKAQNALIPLKIAFPEATVLVAQNYSRGTDFV